MDSSVRWNDGMNPAGMTVDVVPANAGTHFAVALPAELARTVVLTVNGFQLSL
jgi:hypothetical protein